MFLLYYRDFFEQTCSDVQFISPPEEVREFLLHLLNVFSINLREMQCRGERVKVNKKIRVKLDALPIDF